MTRDNSIDIAKGIGIILVVWGHQFANCPIYTWIHLFHIPLFFFLGGCFIKDEKYLIFLYKKIRTLFIPFLFFYTSSLFLKIIIYRMREGSFNFMQDTYLYSTTSINFPLWFIICLFISINIYYFTRRLKHNFIVILLTTFVGAILFYFQISLPFFISQALLATVFLYLGEKTYKRRINNKVLFYTTLATIPIFIYAGIGNIKTDMGNLIINSNFLIFLLPAVCGISFTLLISRLFSQSKISRPLQILGKYSLFVFALHVNTGFLKPISRIAMEITPPYLLNIVNTNIFIGIINTITATLFSLFIGFILNRYFPVFFGYKPNDKTLTALKNKFK